MIQWAKDRRIQATTTEMKSAKLAILMADLFRVLDIERNQTPNMPEISFSQSSKLN
jgi:hypothetical protein